MGPDLSDQQALFGVPWSNEFDPTGEAAGRRVGATSVAHRELIAGIALYRSPRATEVAPTGRG